MKAIQANLLIKSISIFIIKVVVNRDKTSIKYVNKGFNIV